MAGEDLEHQLVSFIILFATNSLRNRGLGYSKRPDLVRADSSPGPGK